MERTEAAAAYLNFYLTSSYLASIIPLILSKQYLSPLAHTRQPKVLIEFSQPNTHKAFHVGHTRNAALGDCLVRLYEQMGHTVVAANYFGDEGAHVAKCLWWLNRYRQSHPQFRMEDVPEDQRGEWLGSFYSDAVEQLDLGLLTLYPFPQVIPARVLSVACTSQCHCTKELASGASAGEGGKWRGERGGGSGVWWDWLQRGRRRRLHASRGEGQKRPRGRQGHDGSREPRYHDE